MHAKKSIIPLTNDVNRNMIQELIEKKILKTGPYRPSSGYKENLPPVQREKDIRRDRKKDAYLYKTPPYVLGYTGKWSFEKT